VQESEDNVTVAELKKKIEALDPKTHIVVYRETESGTEFFEISDASLSTGTPRRFESGKVGFTFDPKGPATWLLISIEEP
jgi:hypothetical protein